jgi:hypothetical protein
MSGFQELSEVVPGIQRSVSWADAAAAASSPASGGEDDALSSVNRNFAQGEGWMGWRYER